MIMSHTYLTAAGSLRSGSLVLMAALLSMQSCGCAGLFPFGECFPPPNPDGELRLRGNVFDADTSQGLKGADVAALLITGGVETTRDTGNYLTEQDGAFVHDLIVKESRCVSTLDLPIPDQLMVIVSRDGCEQTFVIDINEDTVVDLAFPDRVIELKEPILVPACE